MKRIDNMYCIVISMEEFLENYANIDNNLTSDIIGKLKRAKATHRDLTLLGIPYIKRIPYEEVMEDQLLMGNIILVNDFKGSNKRPRVAPYIRPSLLKQQEETKQRTLHNRLMNTIN